MAKKLTRKECEARNWFWNEAKQTCKEPKIGLIVMTLTRGTGCDGPSRRREIRKPLPPAVKKVLLKAGRKPK